MKKRMLAAAITLTVAMGVAPAWAGGEMDESIRQEMQALREQNRLLLERLNKLEQVVAENKASQQAMATTPEESAGNALAKLNDRVEIHGLIEAEGAVTDDFAGTNGSDITLATVELALDAKISEWSTGHLLFKYEDGTNFDVDEGTITIGNSEKYPLFLSAGKMYVPFGNFQTAMVSDPLTLQLAETNENTLLVGAVKNGWHGALYAFNGDMDETGKDDMVRSWGGNVGYGFEKGEVKVEAGASWISNIGDSNGITDGLNALAVNTVDDQVAGFGAYLLYNHGHCGLTAEYTGAAQSFRSTELAFNGNGAKPAAWNLEGAYTTELLGKEATFALSYQGSHEALALNLPEARYLASVGIGLVDYTTLKFEVIHAEDYDTEDGGTGNDAQSVTMQLAVEF
ncbi:MAG: LbtU family siderophore porin [Desulfobulbaceae bacterium]|nr:LbtU family siderophore porin [Desulfobulbaceae bacterium]